MSAERRSRSAGWQRVVRVGDWPLAVKMTVLCTVIAVLLSGALTTIGYLQASAGLTNQAEAALGADARLVETTVDAWHQQRLATLRVGAATTSVARLAEQGDAVDPTDSAGARSVLLSIGQGSTEVESAGVINVSGTFVMSTDPATVGVSVPQRDYFQQAMQGREFISGVAVSTVTKKPALYHSVPIKNAAGSIVGVLQTRSSLAAVAKAVQAAAGRLGSGATGVLLDTNGLVIANTLNEDWLLRPTVALQPTVEAALIKGSEWGVNSVTPPALADTGLATAIGVKQPTLFAWTLQQTAYHAMAVSLTQTDWTYTAALPVDTFQAAAQAFLRFAIVAALVGIALAAALAMLASRPIAKAMGNVTLVAQQIAGEDLPAFAVRPRPGGRRSNPYPGAPPQKNRRA